MTDVLPSTTVWMRQTENGLEIRITQAAFLLCHSLAVWLRASHMPSLMNLYLSVYEMQIIIAALLFSNMKNKSRRAPSLKRSHGC